MIFDELNSLVARGLSIRQIARERNCGTASVRYWLNKHKLRTHPVPLLKYSDDRIRAAVASTICFNDTLRSLGISPRGGSVYYNIKRRIKQLKIDTSHHLGRAAKAGPRGSCKRKTVDDIFVFGREVQRSLLLRAMIESGIPYKCSTCSNTGEWQGLPLKLDIDHIDGNRRNCLRNNVRFACPNCHSQYPTSTSSIGT